MQLSEWRSELNLSPTPFPPPRRARPAINSDPPASTPILGPTPRPLPAPQLTPSAEYGPSQESLRGTRSRLIWAFAGNGRVCGRAECTGADFRGAGRVGGAVKAGPLGAARRGSLEGPGGSVVASHHRIRPPPWAVLVAWVGWTRADLTIADRERSEATLVRGHRHTFVPLSGAWCVSGHSQDGLTQLPRPRPQCGGPRRSTSSRPGCARTFSTGLLAGQTADFAISKPVVDQRQKLSGRGDTGDHLPVPIGDPPVGGADGAPPW